MNCIWDQDWLCPNRGSDSMPVMSFKWSWLENLARCHESWDWCGTTKLHEDDMKCNSAMAWKYVFPRPWVDYRAKCFPGCTDAFLTWDCTYNKGQAPGSHSSAHRQKPLDWCLEQSSLSRRAACFSDSRCEDLNSKSQPQISSFRAPLELATKFCRRLGAGAKTPFPLSNAVSDLDTDPIALQPDNLLTKPWQLDCFRLVLYQSKWGLQYNEPLWIPWWIWFSKGFLNLLIIFFFRGPTCISLQVGSRPQDLSHSRQRSSLETKQCQWRTEEQDSDFLDTRWIEFDVWNPNLNGLRLHWHVLKLQTAWRETDETAQWAK